MSHRTPKIFIHRHALEFIEREIVRSDSSLETGGILLGRTLEDGHTLLVTHATPPGPEAERSPTMFEIEAEFQQAILSCLHAKYQVGYVGTWHKHAGNLTRPSCGDHATAVSILRDPEYGLNRLLMPIGVLTESHKADVLVYYINCEERFIPAHWEIVDTDMQHDEPIHTAIESYLTLRSSKEVLSAQACGTTSAGGSNQRVPPREPIRSDRRKPFDLSSLQGSCGPIPSRSEGTAAADRKPAEPQATPWYQTGVGRARLVKEHEFFRANKQQAEFALIKDGRLVVLIACEGELARSTIVFTLPDNYPREPPSAYLQQANDLLPLHVDYPATDESPYLAQLYRTAVQTLRSDRERIEPTPEETRVVQVPKLTAVQQAGVALAFLRTFVRSMAQGRGESTGSGY